MKNWEEYSEHVIRSLARLEDKVDEGQDMLAKHMDQEEARMLHYETKLTRLEQDMKWYSKITGGVGALCGIVFAWMLEHGKR